MLSAGSTNKQVIKFLTKKISEEVKSSKCYYYKRGTKLTLVTKFNRIVDVIRHFLANQETQLATITESVPTVVAESN